MSREHALEARSATRELIGHIHVAKEHQKSFKQELWHVEKFLTYVSLTEGQREWFLERQDTLEHILGALKRFLNKKLTVLKNQLWIYSQR